MYQCTKNICRLCLGSGDWVLIPIFDSKKQLSNRIMSCASIQIHEHDGLPNAMCTACLAQLESAYSFRQKVENADKRLHEMFKMQNHKNGTVIEVAGPSVDTKFAERKTPNVKKEVSSDTPAEENLVNTKISNKNSIEEKMITEAIVCTPELVPKRRGRPPGRVPVKRHKKDAVEKEKTKLSNEGLSEELAKDKQPRDNSRKHMCDTCGKTFLYLSNLVDHCRIHTGDKPFICTVCGNRFAQSGHLLIHARTHTGVKPYKCSTCSRAFTVSHALKKHLRTHTGERPYPCSVCSKTFVTSYHLSNHFKRHTGEKNFKCDWPGCTLGFVNVSEMRRHRTRHEKPVGANNIKTTVNVSAD